MLFTLWKQEMRRRVISADPVKNVTLRGDFFHSLGKYLRASRIERLKFKHAVI